MDKPALKVLFFGTPDFAVETLKQIHREGYEIVAVVTTPDKPAGRGRKLKKSAVKRYAEQHGLPLLQPEKLKDEQFIETIKSLQPDVGVVVAFRILPRQVYEIPRLGTFNLHASLLPDYRGAAPINHVIINGEKETGITTFFLNDKVDTGEILLQEKVPVDKMETAGSLHDKLMYRGAKLVLETLRKIEAGAIEPQPQPELPHLHPAPKLTRENTRIDWHQPGERIERFIRGLSPYPGAWSMMQLNDEKSRRCVLYLADFEPGEPHHEPGKIHWDGKNFRIAVRDGWIIPQLIKTEGKKTLARKDFINGLKNIKIDKNIARCY